MSNIDAIDVMGDRDCIGCGFCCVKAPCVASVLLYRESSPCPALTWDEENQRHWCELGLFPGPLGEFYRQEMYMGIPGGCSSNLNSWRKEPLQDRTKKLLDNWLRNPIPKLMQVFLKSIANEPLINMMCIDQAVNRFAVELVEDGYDDETIDIYKKWIQHFLRANRNETFRGFMGG